VLIPIAGFASLLVLVTRRARAIQRDRHQSEVDAADPTTDT